MKKKHMQLPFFCLLVNCFLSLQNLICDPRYFHGKNYTSNHFNH